MEEFDDDFCAMRNPQDLLLTPLLNVFLVCFENYKQLEQRMPGGGQPNDTWAVDFPGPRILLH